MYMNDTAPNIIVIPAKVETPQEQEKKRHLTNAEPGHGLLRIGGSLVPFSNTIPRDTELYRLLSTTPGEK